MIGRIENNLFGVSSVDKVNIFNEIALYLEDKGSKKLKREFYNRFNGYMHSIICFIRFLEDFESFNDEYKANFHSYIVDEYVERVGAHHIDNSPDSRRDSFMNGSKYEMYGDKVTEYVRYFKPDTISSEEVNQFIEEFECMTDEEKNNFIKNLCSLYSRIESFSLPVTIDELDMFKNAVFSFLREDLHINFEMLFPEEKMTFASSVCSFYDYLGFIKNNKNNDNNFSMILKYDYLKSEKKGYR